MQCEIRILRTEQWLLAIESYIVLEFQDRLQGGHSQKMYVPEKVKGIVQVVEKPI